MAQIPTEGGSICKAFFPCESASLGKSPSQRGEAQREGRARGPEGSQGKMLLTLPGDIWINSKLCHPLMLPGLGWQPTTERPSSYCARKSNVFIMTMPVGVRSQMFRVTVLTARCQALLSPQCWLAQVRAGGPRNTAPCPWGQRRGKAVKDGSTGGGREGRCSRAACNDCHGAKHIARALKQPLQGNVCHFHWWGRRRRVAQLQ